MMQKEDIINTRDDTERRELEKGGMMQEEHILEGGDDAEGRTL